MPLASITYNEVVTLVTNWIKANCTNIANYAGMPSCFKPGYSVKTRFAGNDSVNANHTETIVKSIAQVAAATVDSDMTSFLTSIRANTRLNDQLLASEFINFVNDMITFCSTKCSFAVSQYSTSKYLVYTSENTVYMSPIDITTAEEFKIIAASDILSILNSLGNVIKQNLRTIACTYNITMS